MGFQLKKRVQNRPCVLKRRPKCRTHADSEETHFRQRAGRKRRDLVQPTVGLRMPGMLAPTTSQQQTDIQQVAHNDSSMSSRISSGVISGAPGGAFNTGRPNLPLTTFAPEGSSRCRITFSPSNLKETLSPDWRCNARRILLGITNCPLVDMVAFSMRWILRALPLRSRMRLTAPDSYFALSRSTQAFIRSSRMLNGNAPAPRSSS